MTKISGRGVLIGSAWMIGAKVVVNTAALVSTIILARILTPNDFGLVAIATAVGVVVSLVTEMSLSNALLKNDAPDEADFDTAWSMNFLRGIGLAVVLTALAWPLALAYDDARLAAVLIVIAITATIRALENPHMVTFRRALNFRPDFQLEVTEKIASVAVAIALAIIFRSFWALVLGNLFAVLARVALSYLKRPYQPRFTLERWRSLMSFSVWLTLAQTVKTLTERSVPLIIGAFLPTMAVGQYSLGERLASMPIRELIGTLSVTLFPAFSRMNDDPDRLRRAYIRAQGMTSLLAMPMGFGMAAIAEPLVPFLIGAKWLPAVPVIQAVAIASSILAVQNGLPLAMATGKTQSVLHRNIGIFLFQVPLVFAGLIAGLASSIGALGGLAVALILAAIANLLLNVLMVRKLIDCPMRHQLGCAVRPLVASLIMFAAIEYSAELLPSFELAVSSFAGIAAQMVIGICSFAASLLIIHALFVRGASPESEFAGMLRSLFLRKFQAQ